MISWAVRWTQTPSATPLQPIKWNAHFWITFNFWWSAGLVNGLEPHPPPVSRQKNEMLIFLPIKWNASFWIMFTSDDQPCWPPFSRQKNEMLIFWLCSTSDVGQTGQWTQTPSTTPLKPIKWNAFFWIMFTSDDQPGWTMDSNPICHPSPDKKMKCSYFDYVQLLMIGQAGQWTQTPSTTPLQPKKIKCSFLDYVHFWWSAWLIDELEPHLPPLSYQKNEMLNFWLHSTSDYQPSWSIDSKSICQPSPANKMKCFFLDYVHFWWSARLVDGLKPHLPPFSSQKNEMLTFGLRSLRMISQAGWWTQTPSATLLQPKKWNAHFWITLTSNDQPGWSMDSNPIHHRSPANKLKYSFLDYVHFWWSAGLVNGLKPHTPPLSTQKNEMLILGLRSTSYDWLGWSMDWNSLCQPSPAKNMKCYFLDYVQLLMIGWAGQWTQIPSSTPLQPKKWNAHFCITFNIWCWPDWSMNLNLIHHSSPAKNIKCSFLGYIQLLMISWAVRWTQTPSATPLRPIKWNAHFWITFNFWWSAGLVNGLEPHPPPVSRQKN